MALERVWPAIAKRVGELDDGRRTAEDRLFSDDPKVRAAAAAESKTAADGYAEVARLAASRAGSGYPPPVCDPGAPPVP